MFNPGKDLTDIQNRLINDGQILEYLGLTDASDVDKARAILKRDVWDDLPTDDRRICIYFRPSSEISNEILTREILRVDVHVPISEDYVAYDIQTRVVSLIHKWRSGTRIFHSIGQVGDLAAMPGMYCVGNRFKYYITK